MKKITKSLLTWTLFTVTVGLLASCGKYNVDPNVIVEDLFKKGNSGWTVIGDAEPGYVDPSFSKKGGVKGGYIYAKDEAKGGVWFFSSSDNYKGDKSEFYDKTLTFHLFQESKMTRQFSSTDVIFRNDDQQVYYLFDEYPGKEWTLYSIKINDLDNWYVGEFSKNEEERIKATEEDIKDVLSNVTEFLIRGEYETGPDTGGLTRVQISK